VLGLPARNEADLVALLMLAGAPDRGKWTLDIASPDLLASEIVGMVEDRDPAVVLIGALAGAGNTLHLRYLCKRLRGRFPDLRIALGWWGGEVDAATRTGLMDAGADRLAVTLGEANAHLQELGRLERSTPPTDTAVSPARPSSAA
jgi:hypothetical protein